MLVAFGSLLLFETGRWQVGEVFVGLDWAEDHHDVHVQDAAGQRLAAGRVPEGVAGVARFHELVAASCDSVCIPTPDGLVVGIKR